MEVVKSKEERRMERTGGGGVGLEVTSEGDRAFVD